MPLKFVNGDILKTQSQAMFIGLNIAGGVEVNPLETTLRDHHPVYFSEYRRLGRNSHFQTGGVWFYKDTQPWMVGAFIRDAANGVSRLRYLEQSLVKLRNEWQQESLKSLAIAPMGTTSEWIGLKQVITEYLTPLPIPIVVYETYLPNEVVDESIT